MVDWPSVQLKDCVELMAGFAFKSERFTDAENDIPLVKGENVGQGEILWAISKRWPVDDNSIPAKYRLSAGDIVVAMDRPWVPAGLKWAFIRETDPSAYLVQRVARLRADGKNIDQGFLRFVIGGPGFEGYIRPITTGVNVPHISGAQILAHEFTLPPLPIQRRIASILSAYDDLIENHRKRIAILEEMARRLYREWFVHFRYPGHESVPLIDSPLGRIPQGWHSIFSDVSTLSREGIAPANEKAEAFEHFSIPAFDAGGLPLLERRETILSGKFKVTEAAILLSKLNPRIPRIWYAKPSRKAPAIASTEFLVLRPTAVSSTAFLHGLCSSDSFYGRFLGLTGGTSTSHQRVRPETLLTLQVPCPPKPVMNKFDSFYLPIIELEHNLRHQIATLRRTRDLLLPRLMSGTLSDEALATAEAAVP